MGCFEPELLPAGDTVNLLAGSIAELLVEETIDPPPGGITELPVGGTVDPLTGGTAELLVGETGEDPVRAIEVRWSC